ncbi:MAG: fatty acid desaturase [Chitinophagales bacterium]
MLQGKELILATKTYAKEVRWKSWYFTISTLLILIALFIGTVMVPFFAGRLICSIFAGFVLVRLFVIYHDHQHHSILTKSWIADALFTVFGILILVPTSIWKRTHDYHHAHNSRLYTASIGSFPIFTREKYLKCTRSQQIGYLAIRHPLTILMGYISVFLYGMTIQSFLSSPGKHWDSMIAVILHVAVSVLIIIFFGWQIWLLSICLPFSIACAMGAYLFYAQHNFPGVTFQADIEWSYDHAAWESSSHMEMNFFWRWVTANIGYHHIHHINSRIPFYRLPEVMAAIPELQTAKVTSLNPSDIIACFRLKVWDTERQQMIGLDQI